MKYRLSTRAFSLFASGITCLIVGAVWISRDAVSQEQLFVVQPAQSSADQHVVVSGPGISSQPAIAEVSPQAAAVPATSTSQQLSGWREMLTAPPGFGATGSSTPHRPAQLQTETGYRQYGTSQSADRSGSGTPYHEPEPWPFRNGGSGSQTPQSGADANRSSGRRGFQLMSHDEGHRSTTGQQGSQQPPNAFDSVSAPAAGDNLLNPAIAFGHQGSSPFGETRSNPNAPLFPGFGPSAATSGLSRSGSTPPPEHVPATSIDRTPQQTGLPTPPPPSPQMQGSPFHSAGYAPIGNGEVIHAYVESVTPRKYVTLSSWEEPQQRPVGSIQAVSFDSCPDCDDVQRIPAESLLEPYSARAGAYPDAAKLPPLAGQIANLPQDYAPWWEEVINRPMRPAESTHQVNVEMLILEAIEFSPQVTALRIDPIVRETAILEEAAEFDWLAFLESKYEDNNDPIGNSLTTGDNSDRFVDRIYSSRIGLEKRMAQGGRLDVSQKFGYQNNNSTFFTPTQQGTSRLELNFTQPLMRGAGQTYNESRAVLAMLDHRVSGDDLQENLQDHLLEVYTTYWNLYRARAVRLQKEKLLRRASEIEQKLSARQGVDAVRRQVLRARAAVASRRSEIARADMEIRNAESRLRLLVNSPRLKQSTLVELLPTESPLSRDMDVSLRGSVETALQNRPDISRAIRRMKETAVRLEVSKNELLPKLDFVVGTYVAGLRGRGQIATAVAEQFTDGRPGYSVGLMVEYPLGNRAARARYARREWEVARALKEFEAAVETGMTDVELAVREFETSYQEMLSRFQAMIAADTEANYLLERWRLLPGSDQTTSFLLEDLLDAQERVAGEEQDFVEAQVAYVLSTVRLKRAAGILLNCDCGNSPVSFMTPATSSHVEPRPLPPRESTPILPEPAPSKATPEIPILPETPAGEKRNPAAAGRPARTLQSKTPDDAPSLIPLPAPNK